MRLSRRVVKAALLAACMGICNPVPAMAQYTGQSSDDYFPVWYIGLRGSVNTLKGSDLGTYPLPDTDYDPGFAVGASVGVKLPRAIHSPWPEVSFEAEVSRYWQHIDNDRTNLVFPIMLQSDGERAFDVTAFMANMYLNFQTNTMFTPYIGGGYGWAIAELERDPIAPIRGETQDEVPAWQVMVGLSFEEDPRALTQWNVGYRYFTSDEPEFDDGFGGKTVIDNTIHSLEAGVKFRF